MYRTSNVRTADEPRRDHSEKRFVTKGFIEHASQKSYNKEYCPIVTVFTRARSADYMGLNHVMLCFFSILRDICQKDMTKCAHSINYAA